MRSWVPAVVVVAVSCVLTLLVVGGVGWLLNGLQDELRLPLLIVSAVGGLLAGLTLIVTVFALYELADRKYALGLPDGSVRAVIALLLIVLFSTLTVFLTIRLKQTDAGEPVVDFAKQLLTILGTLMTSVTGFYFGSRAVAEGSKIVADGGASPPSTTGTGSTPGPPSPRLAPMPPKIVNEPSGDPNTAHTYSPDERPTEEEVEALTREYNERLWEILRQQNPPKLDPRPRSSDT